MNLLKYSPLRFPNLENGVGTEKYTDEGIPASHGLAEGRNIKDNLSKLCLPLIRPRVPWVSPYRRILPVSWMTRLCRSFS